MDNCQTFFASPPSIYRFAVWVEEAVPDKIVSALEKSLNAAEYVVLDFIEHRFSPEGYTALWLLAESHLALHTFPEAHRSYIELSGCSEVKNCSFQEAFAACYNYSPA